MATEFLFEKILQIVFKNYIIGGNGGNKRAYISYYNENNILFKQDFKNNILWVDYPQIWQILEMRYNMNRDEIKSLIKEQAEKHLKIKGFIPVHMNNLSCCLMLHETF